MMASEIEVQISASPDRIATVGDSTAGHESQRPFSFPGIFLPTVIYCFCLVPTMVVLSKEKHHKHLQVGLLTITILTLYLVTLFCYRTQKFRKRKPEGIAAIYYKSERTPTIIGQVVTGSWTLFVLAVLLISWGMFVNEFSPKLKTHNLLGSPLSRWTSLAFITVFAAYFMSLLLSLVVFGLVRVLSLVIYRSQKTNLYLYNGLLPFMMLVFHSGIILGVWVGYFKTDQGFNQSSKTHSKVLDHVQWICISLFVGSFLTFLKACLLMLWGDKSIYRRFEPRILMTNVKFLYLCLITGDYFIPDIIWKMELLEEYALHPASEENYSFQKYIMSKHVDTDYLYWVSQYLTSLAKNVRQLQNDGIPELLEYFRVNISATSDKCEPIDLVQLINCWDLSSLELERLKLRHKYGVLFLLNPLFPDIFRRHTSEPNLQRERTNPIKPDDLSPGEYRNHIGNVLHCIVREQCRSAAENHFTFDDLKRWMVDAHLNCVNMGRTLEDATAIVFRLDMLLSIIIYVLVVLMWLLMSGIATYKVLITFGTPFLTLAFIFGESGKTYFQGVIFCFAAHSFDVGDRCILDDIELEVERIGILTTRFIKIGTDERRMYPNAVLATKAIINKGWQPDPSDTVELKLDMSTFRKQWKALESELERFFKDDEHRGVFESWHEVTMEEFDDKIKVLIHFKHVLNVKEMTHGQCFKKKKRQRSIILKSITQFIEPDQPIKNYGDNYVMVSSSTVPKE